MSKNGLNDETIYFITNDSLFRFESDVVEERRQSALKLLEFVARNPPLFTSDVFVKFFEVKPLILCNGNDTEKLNPFLSDQSKPIPS